MIDEIGLRDLIYIVCLGLTGWNAYLHMYIRSITAELRGEMVREKDMLRIESTLEQRRNDIRQLFDEIKSVSNDISEIKGLLKAKD